MTADAEKYLAVGAMLFVLGAIGFLTRRNLILMVLSAELMLHGVALTLVTFSQVHQNLEGQVFTIFILTVAACEAGLALALVLALYQKSRSLDVDLWSELREPDLQSATSDDRARAEYIETLEPLPPLPTLTPAGIEPVFRRARDARLTAPVTPLPPKDRQHPQELKVPSVP